MAEVKGCGGFLISTLFFVMLEIVTRTRYQTLSIMLWCAPICKKCDYTSKVCALGSTTIAKFILPDQDEVCHPNRNHLAILLLAQESVCSCSLADTMKSCLCVPSQ